MPKAKALKLGELMAMTARELAALSESELKVNYQNIKKIVNSRVNTFEKHGIGEALPVKIQGGLPSSRGRSEDALLQDIKESLAWMRGSRSTYAGYQKAQDTFRERMQESMPDLDLSDEGKMKSFGEFMGDMQARYGEMWHAISNQARDIYREAIRLNTDPRAMMKNYDYWADHIEDLENADPIRSRSGRQLKPSEYARKLGLEKIGGGDRRPGGRRRK